MLLDMEQRIQLLESNYEYIEYPFFQRKQELANLEEWN